MKRYRVTQYQQLSDLGKAYAIAMYGNTTPRVERLAYKDFRWLWTAKVFAYFHRGESAGLGLRLFTTTIEEIDE